MFNTIKSFKYKRSLQFVIVGFLLLALYSCSEDSNNQPIIEEGTEITSFYFSSLKNPSLDVDIYLDIEGDKISGNIPIQGDIENLIANFEHTGNEISVGNTVQISGTTFNNYTQNLVYTVKTSTGEFKNYTVELIYYTGLPIIYIDTNNVPIDSKDDYREGFSYVFGNKDYLNLVSTEMKIRGRGNSTWYFHPKKAFQLKFNSKTELLGMPEDKKWIFLAEHSDKTLLRNKIAFEMGYLSNLDWTPKSHFAEVFINNEYNGTYNITQKVEESDHRVVIGDTGFLMEIDQLERMKSDDVYFYSNKFLINIKEPEVARDDSQFMLAKNLVLTFETALYGDNFKNPTVGYAKYIDVDSFVDWYLISEITKNQDSKSWSSIFLNVIPGEKIKMGPLWDFDLAFGNVDYSDCEFPEGFWVKDNPWYEQLFKDPTFISKVKTRFQYFKENQNFILEKIDAYASYLELAQSENDLRWDTIGVPVWPNPIVYPSYSEEVDHLKTWYSQRMHWLDNAFKNL